MKKYLFTLALTASALCGMAQTQYVLYVDSAFMSHVSATAMPMVSIYGRYNDLTSKPAISINGVSQTVTNGQSWTVSGSAVAIPILPKTANYTVVSGDFGSAKVLYVSADATAGNMTITLPTASGVSGYTVIVTKTDATGNSVTISGLSSDNVITIQNSSKEAIAGSASYTQN